ncbi:MFS transporter [Halolamina sp. CBA1230]|uniref:MFS transporter n=1 Tax=Halolamina sp. CBA1230 TaxID=1853690 RepID=UPI0009A22E64|nr:MFS transporter [Halolamina sp. CBA1230]QKY19157.1 MFS transporter [Halolamina sp. CBA1230]
MEFVTDTPGDDRWLRAWAVGYAAVGGSSVLLPLYALSLDAGAFLVGLMASTAAFAGVPGAIVWGRIAGRANRRRPFVLFALIATAAVLLASPMLRSTIALVVANAALWFAVTAASPVLNLVVVEGFEQSAWDGRIARLNALQGWGWLAGLLVGTVWTAAAPRLGYTPISAQRTLLTGFGLLAVLATVLFVRFYPDAAHTSDERFLRRYRSLSREGWRGDRFLRGIPYGPSRVYWALRSLRSGRLSERFGRPLLGYLAGTALFSAGFAVFWGPMPAHLTEIGFGDGIVFLCFLANTLGATVCYDPVGRLMERYRAANLQFGALIVRAALFVVTAFLASRFLIGGALAAIGVTWAVVAVTTTGIVARLADDRFRGEALGLVVALTGVGAGVGNAVGGAVAAATNPVVTFGLAAATVLVGCGVAAVAIRPTRGRP